MQIRDIEVINLRFEYPPDGRFRYAGGVCTGRVTSLIRVHTDSDLVGLGSVYSHPDLVRLIVEGHLRPALVGEDPSKIERIWKRCYKLTRWYGRKGAAVSALGGIEIALWDLRGKVAGKPISALLDASRSRVPAYASGLLWNDDLSELEQEAKRHLDEGFQSMKMRLGRHWGYDCVALAAVREAIGPDMKLMIDGNARYSLDGATRMIPRFRDAGIFWLEEPFPPEDPDSFRALRPSLSGIRLAAGENEFGEQGFRELIDPGIVHIVQPDCCRCGGLTPALRIADRAQAKGLQVAPHTWSDAVALVANMHFVAATPNALTVEVDRTGNPFIDDLLTEPLRVEEGMIPVPGGPGLGIELNEEVVGRYEVPRNRSIAPGNYSDMVFQ